LASIIENWQQKIKIGDFFGSNIFGARATPESLPKILKGIQRYLINGLRLIRYHPFLGKPLQDGNHSDRTVILSVVRISL
jgi:hypothetical protein